VEVVGAGDFTAEGDTASASATSSSWHLLFFHGVTKDDDFAIVMRPKKPRLRSLKSLLGKSSSYEVSEKLSSPSEERSTTGTFSEGPPCSKTGEQWWCKETSDGDPGGGGDPNSADVGVETLVGEEDSSLEGE
jgi:hypothetical protein